MSVQKYRSYFSSPWHLQRKGYSRKRDESIKVVPLWHGTADSVVRNVCETGFAALATTDDGYFGKGLYFTNSAGKNHAGIAFSSRNAILHFVCELLTFL